LEQKVGFQIAGTDWKFHFFLFTYSAVYFTAKFAKDYAKFFSRRFSRSKRFYFICLICKICAKTMLPQSFANFAVLLNLALKILSVLCVKKN